MDIVLYMDGVTVSFDGFKALNNLSLLVWTGDLRAVIGPNGAGKTTMMDVITGKTRPDKGRIIFNGRQDLTKLDEAACSNLGIGRKFQKPSVFEARTVFENLEMALAGYREVRASLFFRLTRDQKRHIDDILELTALGDSRHRPAGTLSHGQKQWLEIGMLLMQDPQLMLLDEPVAGMTDAETEQTARLLKDLSDGQRSVVVVEHDMEFVRDLSCPVTVLHEGRVLAEGDMDTVQANQEVIEVYLGR